MSGKPTRSVEIRFEPTMGLGLEPKVYIDGKLTACVLDVTFKADGTHEVESLRLEVKR